MIVVANNATLFVLHWLMKGVHKANRFNVRCITMATNFPIFIFPIKWHIFNKMLLFCCFSVFCCCCCWRWFWFWCFIYLLVVHEFLCSYCNPIYFSLSLSYMSIVYVCFRLSFIQSAFVCAHFVCFSTQHFILIAICTIVWQHIKWWVNKIADT